MMFNDLTIKEYIDILQYYNVSVPSKSAEIKEKAEKIITNKLCGCINKLTQKNTNNTKSIGVCTKSVVNNKGFSIRSFKCKNPKRNVTMKHKSTSRYKTSKKANMKTTRKVMS